jgi:hypothetical protein
MSNLDNYKNNSRIRKYFRDKLELDDDEFDRRFQMYLEIFPFLAVDFRLKDDCHFIHREAKLAVRSSDPASNISVSIIDTPELEPHYLSKSENYRAILEEIRESLYNLEVEISLDT